MNRELKYFAFIFPVFLFFSGCKKDEGLTEEQKGQFIKFYGTTAVGNDMKKTSDGGYVMVGTIRGSASTDVFLVKTDAYGNVSWLKSYDGPAGETDDEGKKIIVDANNNFAVTGSSVDRIQGTTEFELTSTLFMLIDWQGNVLRNEVYNSGNPEEHETGNDIIRTQEGSYVIAGERMVGQFISALAYEIFDSTYSSFVVIFNPEVNSKFKAVVQISGGSLIFAGSGIDPLKEDLSLMMAKISNIGDIGTEDYSYTGFIGEDEGYNLILTSDGVAISGGYIVENGFRQAMITKNNLDYPVPLYEWNYIRQGTGGNSTVNSLIEVSDGFVLAGAEEDGAYGSQMYLAKVSLDGATLIWEKKYGYRDSDIAKAVVETDDGGFAVFGTSTDERGNTVMCLIKTDANGDVK